jgi:magnesium-transporting ATPase (P-type)
MTTPDADRTAEALVNVDGTVGCLAGPPARPDEPTIPTKSKNRNIRVSPAVLDAARKVGEELLRSLRTTPQGLKQAEAEERARTTGPNEVAQERRQGWPVRLLKIIRNPLVILLATLSAVSFGTGDARAGSVMAVMVALSVGLRFLQEATADAAAAKLKAMIHVTATVIREGDVREMPLRDLVPGDVIKLSAGDMIPGDVRVLSSKDLFVSQGSLTGESLPVEKFHDAEANVVSSPTELKNTCFMGTSVQSGTATAVVVTTGVNTYLGSMAGSITEDRTPTSFDQGLSRFTWLMIRLMAVMVPLVFLINGFTKHDWKGAFFFAMAVAVGLTPEMLPMIVSVCLSKGALAMSRKKVIVKRLNAIQNSGGMDVLCTDKTGTLTEDRVVLQRHCNVAGRETDEVLLLGYLISHFQTGLKNLLDRAILDSPDFHGQALVEKCKKLDELPFDFTRRMMSVLVEDPEGKAILLAKVIRDEPDLSSVPAQVRPLLKRCLEKDPKKRLRDIGDVWLLLADTPAESAPVSSKTTSRLGRLTGIAVAVLAVALAVVSWIAYRATRPAELKPLVRLDVDLGSGVSLGSPAGADTIISPDGTRLVYVSQNRLFTRRLDQPTAAELAGTEGAYAPFVSPDG